MDYNKPALRMQESNYHYRWRVPLLPSKGDDINYHCQLCNAEKRNVIYKSDENYSNDSYDLDRSIMILIKMVVWLLNDSAIHSYDLNMFQNLCGNACLGLLMDIAGIPDSFEDLADKLHKAIDT